MDTPRRRSRRLGGLKAEPPGAPPRFCGRDERLRSSSRTGRNRGSPRLLGVCGRPAWSPPDVSRRHARDRPVWGPPGGSRVRARGPPRVSKIQAWRLPEDSRRRVLSARDVSPARRGVPAGLPEPRRPGRGVGPECGGAGPAVPPTPAAGPWVTRTSPRTASAGPGALAAAAGADPPATRLTRGPHLPSQPPSARGPVRDGLWPKKGKGSPPRAPAPKKLEEEEEAVPLIPKGKPKSGRVWKDRAKKRFSQMVQDKPLRTSWQRKMKERQERKLARDFARHLEEEKERRRQEKKQRRAENLKRRLENERKAEVVQVIRNPAKLKRAKKKQLRSIQKRDTLALLQPPPQPAAQV
ncbi:hypothetical protein QTO34_003188 [Cnephaeus nilssonii]|uniref:Coiled-coil domain-containing protein 86 n=1 Tax=Cnephaeus nilssonii TaxID=3371016 RepID=A0AA40LKD8_CNENI|nr:hypothetical protein QTO34_003188 [Eptesicus nilssonii]